MNSIPKLFRKSSYSKTNNCVEVAVADLSGATAVRDSQHPDAGHLEFPAAEWVGLLGDVKADRL